MPRRILCIDQFATMGGAQQCVLDLVPFFRQNGCEFEVVLPGQPARQRPGAFTEKLQKTGCTVRFFGGFTLSRKHKPAWEIAPYLLSLRRAVYALQQAIDDARPDLFYVTSPRFLPAAAWVASRFRLPILFHAHNRVTQRSALWGLHAALRRSGARVIACCEYVAASLRPAVPDNRLQVIFNGTSDLQLQAAKNTHPIRTIGTLGRIAPEKGQLAFVRVARAFERAHNLRWVILGSASGEREHQQYLRTVMHESGGLNIDFAGWQDDVATALMSIDLLLVPSLPYDAAPRVIPEAFSAGVPVLACPSGGIREMVDDGVNGFIAPGSEPGDIAGRLARVLQLPASEVAEIAANARAAWTRRFTLEAYRRNVWNAMGASIA